jgi:PilZ domain
MKLVDLVENSKIQIDISFKENRLQYEAIAKFSAFNGIFIEPIKQDDKMLEFNTGKLMISVTAEIEGAQPVIWRECIIKGVKYKNEVYHMITSPKGGLSINRRGRFRLAMGYTGTVRIGVNTGTLNVVVHDLSSSGFSFTTEKDIENFSESVHLVFVDSDNDTFFNLLGDIVRKQEWNNNRFLYGCKLKTTNLMVEYYIAKKQRELIAIHSISSKSIIELKDEKN